MSQPAPLKGKRPKGMKKFKAAVTTSEQPVNEKISESEKKRLKAEITPNKEAERLTKPKFGSKNLSLDIEECNNDYE